MKSYYVTEIEKFQRNEMFNDVDFVKFGDFKYEDYIVYTGQSLKFQNKHVNHGNTVEIPVFIQLRTLKPFIFRINFVFQNYFEKIDTDEEC